MWPYKEYEGYSPTPKKDVEGGKIMGSFLKSGLMCN